VTTSSTPGATAQLREDAGGARPDGQRRAASIDGAAPGDRQQPQRLTPFAAARDGECLARERRASGSDSVEGVVFAAQPPLALRYAAGLEHRLASADEVARKARGVAAGALDRPHACATSGFERKPKR
jgi:hypothetical protein